MKIAIDVQGTILGLVDDSLRPGVKELIDALQKDGHEVVLWTGGCVSKFEVLLWSVGIDDIPLYSKNEKYKISPDLCIDDIERFIHSNTMVVKPHISNSVPGERICAKDVYSFINNSECAAV